MASPDKEPREIPLHERPIAEVSGTLQRVLGQSLVAYALQEQDPRRVGMFARAEAVPTEKVEADIRALAQVTGALLEREAGSAQIARATLIGMNPRLNDQSPIELFHQGEGERVVAAARAL